MTNGVSSNANRRFHDLNGVSLAGITERSIASSLFGNTVIVNFRSLVQIFFPVGPLKNQISKSLIDITNYLGCFRMSFRTRILICILLLIALFCAYYDCSMEINDNLDINHLVNSCDFQAISAKEKRLLQREFLGFPSIFSEDLKSRFPSSYRTEISPLLPLELWNKVRKYLKLKDNFSLCATNLFFTDRFPLFNKEYLLEKLHFLRSMKQYSMEEKATTFHEVVTMCEKIAFGIGPRVIKTSLHLEFSEKFKESLYVIPRKSLLKVKRMLEIFDNMTAILASWSRFNSSGKEVVYYTLNYHLLMTKNHLKGSWFKDDKEGFEQFWKTGRPRMSSCTAMHYYCHQYATRCFLEKTLISSFATQGKSQKVICLV